VSSLLLKWAEEQNLEEEEEKVFEEIKTEEEQQ
jgi:hypothetical protein